MVGGRSCDGLLDWGICAGSPVEGVSVSMCAGLRRLMETVSLRPLMRTV